MSGEEERGSGNQVGCDGTDKPLLFAVRAERTARSNVFFEEKGELYLRNELFIVDVNLDPDQKTLEPYCDPLMSSVGVGTVFRIESVIYVLGFDLVPEDKIPNTVQFCKIGTEVWETLDCLKGLCWMDLKGSDRSWKRGATPPVCYKGLEYALLGGKIYCLPSEALHKACVYLPDQDKWVPSYSPPPPKFKHHMVSKYLISDPVSKCILVHISDGSGPYNSREPSAIYAWYPNVRVHDRDTSTRYCGRINWVCVVPKFSCRGWLKKTTLVDGMLLFYYRKSEQLFSAFDLETKTWLHTVWANEYPSYQVRRKGKSMFHLGNGRMCLCMSLPIYLPVYGSLFRFFFFDFQRSFVVKDGVQTPAITLTYRFLKNFFAKDIEDGFDFVPLGDVHP